MPGLTAIVREQTDNYKKSINPEPEANLVTPVISFLSKFSILSTPIKHLTGEVGRERAENYCLAIEKLYDDELVVEKLCKDLFSDSSVLPANSDYTHELKLVLFAHFTDRSVSDAERDVKAKANKTMKLQLRGVNQNGCPPEMDQLIRSELSSSLRRVLPTDIAEKYFPERMVERKDRSVFPL